MQDIASQRRDNVSLFQKIFLYVKLGAMLVFSVLGSIYFVWNQFYSQVNLVRNPNPTVEQCIKYCNDNLILTISSVICSFVACGFIVFLALTGIEKLVVKYMMRNANTGG